MVVPENDLLGQLSLPPGFRFYPTDEELLVQYLCKKVAGHHFSLQIIGDIDLYKFDPWDLPSKALFGEKEWYFFSPLDRKYPNGLRPNRVAGSGYWKATGTDKVISTEGRRVGIKKALVFYVGKAPRGTKTNWIMHEYRLIESFRKSGSSKLDEWVLCRIYKKNAGSLKQSISSSSSKEHSHGDSSSSSSFNEMLESFSEINDQLFSLPQINSMPLEQQKEDEKPNNIQNIGSAGFGWSSIHGLHNGLSSRTAQPQGPANYGRSHHYYDPGTILPGYYVPAAPSNSEVQSRVQTQQTGGSRGYIHGDSFGFAKNTSYPTDP
ncbi:hypothetical protein MLD38_034192 [Melastoma candidum]|uniref:Uncharacterized protein n=1 Tax=Melastoma candidum TaxID=119954 RepID=A0ACB9MBA2_9MYRT|nr:hypothetical protein MLD38_034192 [Melastoma candidum]